MNKLVLFPHLNNLARESKKYTDNKVEEIALTVNTAIPTALTIPVTAWTAETSGEYEYYADITISGATANDSTNVYFDEDSLEICAEAGVSSATNTTAGKCRIRSVDKPSGALTGVYVLTKGASS